MRKFLLVTLLLSSYINAGLVNAVAFKVDNSIVTLYEIDQAMKSKNLSKPQAIEYLTVEILKKSAIKKFDLDITDEEIIAQIRQIASRNGMSLEQFKARLASSFIDYDDYYKGLKSNLLEQRLFARISQANVSKPSDEELLVFYNNNRDMFVSGGDVEVIKYSSVSQQAISQAIQSPLMMVQGVDKKDLSLNVSTQAPQVASAINRAKEGSFTQLIQEMNMFVTYFIKSKKNTKSIKFEDAKNDVLNTLMQNRQRSSAMLYFQKLKSQSNITYIR